MSELLLRTPAIDQLIQAINANPDDDHNRVVLIDLLADFGAPCAQQFAQARAGIPISRRKHWVTFGPLAAFFKPIELLGGLPHTVTLQRGAPKSEVARLLEDARLGLVHEMKCGSGSSPMYEKLIGSRALVGLQRIDAPSPAVLNAVLLGGHRLTHLGHLAVWDPALVGVLDQPAFDSVRHLEMRIGHEPAADLIPRITREYDAVLARAPRHIEFIEARLYTFYLARLVFAAFPSFVPTTTVSIGGITLSRDGNGIVATIAEGSEKRLRTLLHEVLPEAQMVSHTAST